MRFVATTAVRPLLRETLGTTFVIEPIASGLLNQNLIVTAKDGARFVFKAYRPEMPREKVEETHRIMAHAARRGIPVPLPIATYQIGDHVAALYPFVDGEHPSRDGVGIRRAGSMGEMLGRVERAIGSFRPAMPKPSSLAVATWDPVVLTKEMAGIRLALRGKPAHTKDEVEQTLVAYETILSAGDWSKGRFAKLPVRVCHNDFHTRNVLMRGESVVAVLDWEKSGWDWRGYELFRSVMFNCRGGRTSLDW
jgi:Ser/Thr protein kinase RdoA (MazF antagonist)